MLKGTHSKAKGKVCFSLFQEGREDILFQLRIIDFRSCFHPPFLFSQMNGLSLLRSLPDPSLVPDVIAPIFDFSVIWILYLKDLESPF